MKKVISIICITLLVALYSCDERDDLRSDIDNLKERVANLEASIEQMNSDISNYQQMVEGKILVVGYSKDEQDNYTIELSNGETVTHIQRQSRHERYAFVQRQRVRSLGIYHQRHDHRTAR